MRLPAMGVCRVLVAALLCHTLLAAVAGAGEDRTDLADVGIGHASVGWQQDDADGDSAAFALSLPFASKWYFNASVLRSDNLPGIIGATGRIQASSQFAGLSLDRDGWGGSLSLLRSEDEAVLASRETQAIIRHRGEHFELDLELADRRHDVTVSLPNRTIGDSFDSRGVGLQLGLRRNNGLRAYLGWQQYDYDDTLIFDATFRALLERANQYPDLRAQLLRTYNSAVAQQRQAQGNLARRNGWLGLDVPLADHVLVIEHYVSEAEFDGSKYRTDSAILMLNLADQWGLDFSAGVNRDEFSNVIRFVGLTGHVFW